MGKALTDRPNNSYMGKALTDLNSYMRKALTDMTTFNMGKALTDLTTVTRETNCLT